MHFLRPSYNNPLYIKNLPFEFPPRTIFSSRLITTATRRTHRSFTSTFQFHGLGTRAYSFRRTGGVRGLIAKRGLGLNSSAGLTHPAGLFRRPTSPPTSTSHKNTIAKTGLFSSLFGAFSTSSSAKKEQADGMSYPVQKTEEEWRAVLSPEQFRILRTQGTEAPHTGEYDSHYADTGVYNCAGCQTPLYKATTKFKSGCGWPAFYENLPGKVLRKEDRSFGVTRTEIVCANCGGHLGHVFKGEGYKTPTDERHCVNSISLKFVDGGDAGIEAKASKA